MLLHYKDQFSIDSGVCTRLPGGCANTHLEAIPLGTHKQPLGSSTSPGMTEGTDQLPFKAALNRELKYAEELRKDDGMLCTCFMSLPLQEDIVVVPLHALGCDLFVLLQQPADGITQSSIQTTFSIKSIRLTLCSC